jgi:acetylornithine/succinyldiaminopimelate/putrescine aminotransferase/predicted amino acid dehydrogenase
MSSTVKHAEPFVTAVLTASGMDVEYVRAKGNTLFHRDENGAEAPVLDLVGGWGSLILGHNHPEIVACAKEFLDAGSPVHTQLSLHGVAEEVGVLLNDILHREFPGADDYTITFANSGAEAIEAAVKHAELDRVLKVRKLFQDIEWNMASAIDAVGSGAATLPEDWSLLPEGQEAPTDAGTFAATLAALAGQNLAQLAKKPVFFALERAFHGKLVGSVQLTHNPAYRAAFDAIGLATRFVPPEDPEAVRKIAGAERVTVLDVEVVAGRVALVERDFPIFGGFLVEPIQGEGGIHPLTEDYARELRRICDELDCPLIVDEIQSGMGRTGAFFAGSWNGLLGDYVTLAKSLGGGVAKVAATLVRKSRYRKEFELVHSSTFAKDGFSTAIALTSLRILEADGGRAYRLAAERGERVLTMLRGLAATFPDVIRDVRGTGLLIGLELTDQHRAASAIIRDKALSGTLTGFLASYLLREHGIRIGPTASAPNVLRIEPSIHLTDEEISRLEAALEQVCLILRHADALHLVHPLTFPGARKPRTEIRDFRAGAEVSSAAREPERTARKVGFVSYVTTPGLLRELDPSVADLTDADLAAFVRRHELFKETMPLPEVRIDSPLGTSVDLTIYPLLVTSDQMAGYRAAGRLDDIRADIEGRVRAARADGCEVVGLGFAAAAAGRGSALRVPGVALTSGGALTVASAMDALTHAAEQWFGGMDGLTLAVVGGGGSIGSACGVLGGQEVARIVLIGSGRDGSARRLHATAHRIYQQAWSRIAEGGELRGIPALLTEEPLVEKWLREGRSGAEPSGEAIAGHLAERYGRDPFVVVTDEPAAVREGHLVVSATSSPEPFLTDDHILAGAVICDLGVPGSLSAGFGARRDDLVHANGGVLNTPNGASLPRGARGSLATGKIFAGMAEAVVVGLAGPESGHFAGAVTGEQARRIGELARRHGFVTPTD